MHSQKGFCFSKGFLLISFDFFFFSHLIVSPCDQKGRYSHIHFMGEKTKAQKKYDDLPRVTQLIGGTWNLNPALFQYSGLILSASFSSAQLLSRYRPRAAVIAVTRSAQAARQAHLCRGVFPVLYCEPPEDIWADDVDRRVQFGIESGEPPSSLPPSPGFVS